MKIAFFYSNFGGSPLVVGMERGLRQLGHSVQCFHPHGAFDLIIVWNQTAHTTNYVYPEFPRDAKTPIAFIDSAEYGYSKRYPDVAHNYANAFSSGSMAHDTKNAHEQTRLRHFLEGRSFPYFLREFSKYIEWPANYSAIDYPAYLHSECHESPDRSEYLRREPDIFVSWGASHPWRLPITEALRACNVKGEIHVLEQNGATRLAQQIYFPKTRAAKCSVSFDGYGSGSFRMTEVLMRTLLLQGPMHILTRAPIVDGVTCREYSIESNGAEFVSTNIESVLRSALADPDRSFEIYERGYHHCHQFLSERATSKYVMDTIAAHNWSHPTQLDIPLDAIKKPT